MTMQGRRLGSRLLLILAFVAALLASIVASQWAMSQSYMAQAAGTSSQPEYLAQVGNDMGGAHWYSSPLS